MLHILLLILKVIGIILATILWILILLILILLFVPVRYEVQGVSKGTFDSTKGKVEITWLLHLIRIDFLYKNQHLAWKFRVAFWKRGSAKKQKTVKKEEKADEESDAEPIERTQTESLESTEEKPERLPEKLPESATSEAHETKSEKDAEKATKNDAGRVSEKTKKKRKKRTSKGSAPHFFEKIKAGFEDVRKRKTALSEKKETFREFLTEETHQKAYRKAKKELFRFLRSCKPTKLEGKLKVGFEDPSYTGKLLALLSLFYPFLGASLQVYPDFEQSVFGGNLFCKGKLRLSHLVWLICVLLCNRSVRDTYQDIKNFER